MLFILAAASLAGYFFYTPLFIWGGGITFLLWVLKYIFRKEPYFPGMDMDEETVKYRAVSRSISGFVMFLIVGGALYFFFEWNGLAWAGIVLGILNSKVGYSWEHKKNHGA
jgi:hypothetical protein